MLEQLSISVYSINEFRLFNWLGQQEDMNLITLYQCDYSMTKWTKHCIRQADCILIVALAKDDPAVGEVSGPSIISHRLTVY